MKRRLPKDVRYAPTTRLAKLWTSKAKRRTHKRKRREGRTAAKDDPSEESLIAR